MFVVAQSWTMLFPLWRFVHKGGVGFGRSSMFLVVLPVFVFLNFFHCYGDDIIGAKHH